MTDQTRTNIHEPDVHAAMLDIIDRLHGRIEEIQTYVEALQEKIASCDCACSYEYTEDVCDAHSPTVARLESELAGVHAGSHCIVPVTPTGDMIAAAHECSFPVVTDIYEAMLKASKGGET